MSKPELATATIGTFLSLTPPNMTLREAVDWYRARHGVEPSGLIFVTRDSAYLPSEVAHAVGSRD